MKKFYLVAISLFLTVFCYAQQGVPEPSKGVEQFVITKNDGTEYIGEILSDDGREVLINTLKLGKIYIPKADIRSMVKIEGSDKVVNGEYQPSGPFTTRYAFTTNALPISKGENYTMLNLYGPEVHFAVSNNLSIGIMSTWIASPLVLALKYSFKKKESKVNFSLGTLMATSGYFANFRGYGGLHFGNMTIGDRKRNITFSAGYGYWQPGRMVELPAEGVYYNTYPIYSTGQRPIIKGPIFSIAGIFKVGAKASIVFDTMLGLITRENRSSEYQIITQAYSVGTDYYPETFKYSVRVETQKINFFMLMPGMRFQTTDKSAFQISLAGVSLSGGTNPVSFPFPMLSVFNKF
jgi:hypothetical protein